MTFLNEQRKRRRTKSDQIEYSSDIIIRSPRNFKKDRPIKHG